MKKWLIEHKSHRFGLRYTRWNLSLKRMLLYDWFWVPIFYAFLFTIFFSPVLFHNQLLAPGDGIVYYLPGYYARNALWTSLIFSGFPFAADPQTMTWYPPALLLSLFSSSWNTFMVLAYVLASTFTYFFAKEISGSRFGGLISGIVYGMSGFFMVHLGHAGIVHSAVWLPLILRAVHKLREGFDALWFSIGCVAVAFSILAGHLQIAIYSLGLVAIYALVIGWPACARRWLYYATTFLAVLGGAGIAAIQLVPTMELGQYSLRNQTTFEFFNQYSVPPLQLLTLLFPSLFGGLGSSIYREPYFGAWNLTELTGYVGLLPLMLSLVALGSRKMKLQTVFWVVVAIISILLVLGPSTPLASLMYRVPLYNSFRVPARHFLEFSLAISLLAAFGIAFLQREAKTIRLLWGKRVVIFSIASSLFLLLIVGIVRSAIETQALSQGVTGWSHLFWQNTALGIPMAIMLLGCTSLLIWCRSLGRKSSIVLMIVLAFDLASFGWFHDWHYGAPDQLILQCPSPLRKYEDILKASNQRLATYRGGHGLPEEASPNLNLLWNLPNVSGYGPLITSRYSRLLDMEGSGGLKADSLYEGNRALDILAARYILVPSKLLNEKQVVFRNEVSWSVQDLNVNLGQKCGESGNSEISFAVPQIYATDLALVTAMGSSLRIPDDFQIAQVTLETTSGNNVTLDLRAGTHTSEWAWDRSDVQRVVSHGRANIFESFVAQDTNGISFDGHRYLAVLPLRGLQGVNRIRFRWNGPCGANLSIYKITLQNSVNDSSYAVDAFVNALTDQSRWRSVQEELRVVVYENLRAFPRAWLASQVLRTSPDQILTTIKGGRLPNGMPFDPQNVALIEEAVNLQPSRSDNNGWAKIIKLKDASIELITHSESEAFLVLSDANYPGWQATIDGEPTHIFQTDYVLRGILLPAGDHYVQFAYRPLGFYIGVGISSLTILLLLVLLINSRRRPRSRSSYGGDGGRKLASAHTELLP